MPDLQSRQFTHLVEQKDGGWSGSVTPIGAKSAAESKAIIEQSGTHKVTTGLSAGALASGQYRETNPQATRSARASVAGKGRAGRMLQGMQKTQRQSFKG